jgi:hypothetical protein
VETVTETVQDTAATVGRTFNLRLQVQRHPWLVFGGSVAVGCCAAYLLFRPRRNLPPQLPAYQPPSAPLAREDLPPPGEAERQKSFLREELGKLKGLAIGSMLGVFRDLLVRELPEALGRRLEEEMNTITTKLGGEPVKDKLIEDKPQALSAGGEREKLGRSTQGHNGGHNGGHKHKSTSKHNRLREGPPPS